MEGKSKYTYTQQLPTITHAVQRDNSHDQLLQPFHSKYSTNQILNNHQKLTSQIPLNNNLNNVAKKSFKTLAPFKKLTVRSKKNENLGKEYEQISQMTVKGREESVKHDDKTSIFDPSMKIKSVLNRNIPNKEADHNDKIILAEQYSTLNETINIFYDSNLSLGVTFKSIPIQQQ